MGNWRQIRGISSFPQGDHLRLKGKCILQIMEKSIERKIRTYRFKMILWEGCRRVASIERLLLATLIFIFLDYLYCKFVLFDSLNTFYNG